MTQGVIVVAVVTIAATWLCWHLLPQQLRRKVTGKKGKGCGCGCGD